MDAAMVQQSMAAGLPLGCLENRIHGDGLGSYCY